MKQIFLATNNEGKVERYKKLLKATPLEIEFITPNDALLPEIEVEETGHTLEENAELKARAYFGKTTLPILSNDTGFFVRGEGFIHAPKRTALQGKSEKDLSKEEIAKSLLGFWKSIAQKHGGRVDAAWIEAFILLFPNGRLEKAESRREVILTDEEFGQPHIQMPVRALYISKTTNKPVVRQTPEEEILEMKPVITALTSLLNYDEF